jgi:hypothetical protein
MMPKTMSSSAAITGWTKLRVPTRNAATRKANPKIMLAIPSNQTGG